MTGQSTISRIKDDEKLATTTIYTSQPEFYGYFATGNFSQEKTDTDFKNETDNKSKIRMFKRIPNESIQIHITHMNGIHKKDQLNFL